MSEQSKDKIRAAFGEIHQTWGDKKKIMNALGNAMDVIIKYRDNEIKPYVWAAKHSFYTQMFLRESKTFVNLGSNQEALN